MGKHLGRVVGEVEAEGRLLAYQVVDLDELAASPGTDEGVVQAVPCEIADDRAGVLRGEGCGLLDPLRVEVSPTDGLAIPEGDWPTEVHAHGEHFREVRSRKIAEAEPGPRGGGEGPRADHFC